jgi:hypothetical protein
MTVRHHTSRPVGLFGGAAEQGSLLVGGMPGDDALTGVELRPNGGVADTFEDAKSRIPP